MVNQKAPLPGICSVYSDDARGAREAVRCLIRRGHRRIMFLRPPYSVTSADLREQGFREALRAAGIPVREEWIVRAIAPPITDEMIAFIRKAALTAAFVSMTGARSDSCFVFRSWVGGFRMIFQSWAMATTFCIRNSSICR